MSVLTLEDAKAWLDITGTTYDVELQDVIDAAEAALTVRVGPLEPTEVSVRVRGGALLVLPVWPAISVESVTSMSGTALDVDDLHLDTVAGVVVDASGAAFPMGAYDLVYTAGRETCPDDLMRAIKELVRHLWQPRRGPKTRSNSVEQDAPAGPGGLFPSRVTELIAPHMQPRIS